MSQTIDTIVATITTAILTGDASGLADVTAKLRSMDERHCDARTERDELRNVIDDIQAAVMAPENMNPGCTHASRKAIQTILDQAPIRVRDEDDEPAPLNLVFDEPSDTDEWDAAFFAIVPADKQFSLPETFFEEHESSIAAA